MMTSAGTRDRRYFEVAGALAFFVAFTGCSGHGLGATDGGSGRIDGGLDSVSTGGQGDAATVEGLTVDDGAIMPVPDGDQASALTVTPPSLNFGEIDVGQTSPALVVTVTSAGELVAINPTVTGAGFSITSTTCGAATAKCTISLRFSPISAGPASGLLTVASGLTVSLSGTGIGGSSMVAPSVIPATVLVNQSIPVSVTVTATAALAGFACAASGADLTANPANTTCGMIIEANTPCVYAFTFKSATPGDKFDSIVCTDGGLVRTMGVTPTVVTGPETVITPNPAAFLMVVVGTTSPPTAFTLANVGGSASGNLSTELAGANAAEFAIVDNTCGAPLAPRSACAIQVAFRPKTTGDKSATLTVTDDTAGSIPAVATLNGKGIATDYGAIAISGPADLGSEQVGSAGTPSIYSITNYGGIASGVVNVSVGGDQFAIGDDQCTGLALPAGKTCTFSVTFLPTCCPGVKVAVLTASSEGTLRGNLQIQGTATIVALLPDGGR